MNHEGIFRRRRRQLPHWDVEDKAGFYYGMPQWRNLASLAPLRTSQEIISHSIQSYTGTMSNRMRGATGSYWQMEAFDHWVRDEAEMYRIIDYIEDNPLKAGLVDRREDWKFSAAHFRRLTQNARNRLIIARIGFQGAKRASSQLCDPGQRCVRYCSLLAIAVCMLFDTQAVPPLPWADAAQAAILPFSIEIHSTRCNNSARIFTPVICQAKSNSLDTVA